MRRMAANPRRDLTNLSGKQSGLIRHRSRKQRRYMVGRRHLARRSHRGSTQSRRWVSYSWPQSLAGLRKAKELKHKNKLAASGKNRVERATRHVGGRRAAQANT